MRRSTLNIFGISLLALGLGSVVLIERNIRIYETNRLEDTEATHALLHPEDYGAYQRGSEMMTGKVGTLMNSWLQDLEDLGHSRRFAIGIAIVSLVGAASLFFAASRPPASASPDGSGPGASG